MDQMDQSLSEDRLISDNVGFSSFGSRYRRQDQRVDEQESRSLFEGQDQRVDILSDGS